MSRHGHTKLVVSPKMEPESQVLEVIEESTSQEQKDESVLPDLDMEIECLKCNDVMELNSSFDELMYSCECCSFLLKCV
jgi:hypothetical protein